MRLVHLDVHALGLLVMGDKGSVVILVELARHIIGNIEQLSLRRGSACCCQCDGCQQCLELHGMHGSRPFLEQCV
ncbi:hypothetical protein SDC9_210995 [bioreactor metagenome]|uniref:Uncharacterized protein n=1 Tax=bioreactor metagenome TaxID=1076179 RepID=A0A645JHR4_9ZZZZ